MGDFRDCRCLPDLGRFFYPFRLELVAIAGKSDGSQEVLFEDDFLDRRTFKPETQHLARCQPRHRSAGLLTDIQDGLEILSTCTDPIEHERKIVARGNCYIAPRRIGIVEVRLGRLGRGGQQLLVHPGLEWQAGR
ncbi:MAG: hypothetical protein RL434_1900, partial [Pseudomonadota bacterium]